jgi:hypothetical protein
MSERYQVSREAHGESGQPHPAIQEASSTATAEPVALLASNLLAAVDRGSATELLGELGRVLAVDRRAYALHSEEREGLALLQAVAQRLRDELQTMLMQVYQRLESSRACLGLVRHLAERDTPSSPASLAEDSGCQQNVIPWPKLSTRGKRIRHTLANPDE